MIFSKEESKEEGVIQYMFYCPGCKTHHSVTTQGKNRPCWSWNGDINKPTIHPSLRVRFYDNGKQKDMLCHSFIKDGKIEYLHDCTHELKGKTVDLIHWEDT